MISNLEVDKFAEILHSFVTPYSTGWLDPQVRAIEHGSEAPGTTLFVYGDLRSSEIVPAKVVAAAHQVPADASDDSALVIHDFDEITTPEERARFASFVKEIEDQADPVRFVFCGVSESVKKLLGAHESCYFFEENQVSAVKKDALRISEEKPTKKREVRPHHVHLVSEKLFWEMFNDPTFARIFQ